MKINDEGCLPYKSLKQEVWAFVDKDEFKNVASDIDQSSFE